MFKKRDPVCGAKVSKDTEHLLKYDSRIYYFDSQACKSTFKREPERFVRKGNKILEWLSRETDEAPEICQGCSKSFCDKGFLRSETKS